jgi:hypothetical protein
MEIDHTFVLTGTVDQLDLARANLLVDARAVLGGPQRGLHRTTNGCFLLLLLQCSGGVPWGRAAGTVKIGRNGE